MTEPTDLQIELAREAFADCRCSFRVRSIHPNRWLVEPKARLPEPGEAVSYEGSVYEFRSELLASAFIARECFRAALKAALNA